MSEYNRYGVILKMNKKSPDTWLHELSLVSKHPNISIDQELQKRILEREKTKAGKKLIYLGIESSFKLPVTYVPSLLLRGICTMDEDEN